MKHQSDDSILCWHLSQSLKYALIAVGNSRFPTRVIAVNGSDMEVTVQTQAGFLITQIKQIGGRVFDKILQKENISEFNGAQGRILYVLWQNDHISIIELSRQTGLANTTLTSMLDRMEAAGLLCRLPDPKDRRKNLIALTEKATDLKERYDKVSVEMRDIYFKNFNTEEILAFEGYLRRVLDNVKEVE